LKALGLAADCGSGRWEATERGRQRGVSRALGEARSAALARRLAEALSGEPLRQVEVLLAAGEISAANEVARRQIEREPDSPPEAWFELSARLAAAAGDRPPPWLDALEAEREAAGGRAAEALRRLERIEANASAHGALRRACSLRAAELCVAAERRADALRRVASWRGRHPDAPATERLRALRLEASCRTRLGESGEALALLDAADRIAADRTAAERLETALARADVYSRQGRFDEEGRIYGAWRATALGAADERLAARFLSREALWLCDRRDFPSAIDRLEQARGMLHDDPVERARVSIDLASALYHSGRPEECGPLLEEAISLSASGGRQDLVRLARGNRVELLVNRAEWETAEAEIETLLREARREKDEVALLVGLRHRSRLRLRRGLLQESERDNRRAREIAGRLGDRLEVGELWLEDGDRLLYEGDLEGARLSWQRAAADPPDRCDSERRARLRLWELGLREQGGPPPQALALLEELFRRDPYEAAETAARWRRLFGASGFPPEEVTRRAAGELGSRGGALLADRVFGGSARSAGVSEEGLRRLRKDVALLLSGETPAGGTALEPLGLSSLAIAEPGGREIARLGGQAGEDPAFRRTLHAGAATYLLTGSPAVGAEALSAIGLLLETLLYRPHTPAAPSDFAEGWRRFGIVTRDASMEEPYRRLVRFAPQPVTVLVLGESGSGKEAAARAIHLLSARCAGPFVAVNVSAVPAALLESELFGHVRGAFTGAERDRRGLLEEAERGTIFFDEVGDLPSSLQAKLLRVLQEREFRRVGENQARRSDVRVVSATSRDLAREVETGRFREDLYYRLSVAVVALPPLRERGRDPLLLARHFLERFASEYGRGALRLAPDAVAALQAHAWPGNVRELQNAMAQASALAEPDGMITAAQLPDAVRASAKPRSSAKTGDYRSRVNAHRRDLIAEALERAGGNRSRAARDLGLSRQALLYLIRELRVSPRSSH
jgi:DNA-binding NtrC family response regulator